MYRGLMLSHLVGDALRSHPGHWGSCAQQPVRKGPACSQRNEGSRQIIAPTACVAEQHHICRDPDKAHDGADQATSTKCSPLASSLLRTFWQANGGNRDSAGLMLHATACNLLCARQLACQPVASSKWQEHGAPAGDCPPHKAPAMQSDHSKAHLLRARCSAAPAHVSWCPSQSRWCLRRGPR